MPRIGPKMTQIETAKITEKAMMLPHDRSPMTQEERNRYNGVAIRKPNGFRSHAHSTYRRMMPKARTQVAGYPFSSS
jgi:hypothetical protein